MSETKDLGIYITSNLSWSLQANKCANKANSVLGFVRRTVGPKNPDLFSKLYKSLVRPILEYSKTINGLNCLNPHKFFSFADKYRPLRSNHRFKFKTKSAKLNRYKHSFFLRIVNLWNNLRKETAEAKDLRSFRNKLVNEFS